MYKCKQIIELTSQQMDSSLAWYTRLEIKLHLLMCKNCHRYSQQLQFIEQALTKLDGSASTNKAQLSEQAKQVIAEKMRLAKK